MTRTYLLAALLILAACAPGTVRDDCTDGAPWRENCDRAHPRYTRTIVDDSCMRGCKPPRPNLGKVTTASAGKGDV